MMPKASLESISAAAAAAAVRHGRLGLVVRHRHHFSTAARRQTSAQDAASRMLERFGETVFTRKQLIDGNQLQKLSLTLGRPTLSPSAFSSSRQPIDITGEAPPDGTPVPPGYHLVYFTPNGLEKDLGADGTDRTFNAPAPFTRRMWAGGKMVWPGAEDADGGGGLRVGDVAEERTKLLSATAKKSRSAGEMVLVEVEKEVWTPRGLALVDNRSWVFRPEIHQNQVTTSTPPKMIEADVRAPSLLEDAQNTDGSIVRHARWSPTALFRFSALTFNGHKIHYNEDWTGTVERHPGIVVHGPLNLIAMLDYWRDVHGGSRWPRDITYRAMAPVYAGEKYLLRTEETGREDRWKIVVDKGDVVCMQGEITGTMRRRQGQVGTSQLGKMTQNLQH